MYSRSADDANTVFIEVLGVAAHPPQPRRGWQPRSLRTHVHEISAECRRASIFLVGKPCDVGARLRGRSLVGRKGQKPNGLDWAPQTSRNDNGQEAGRPDLGQC